MEYLRDVSTAAIGEENIKIFSRLSTTLGATALPGIFTGKTPTQKNDSEANSGE